nr:somatomedin-B and thrombospondin type-1 domain-containing protein isoform X2 [Parasteatoda tepidariorum]
MVDCKVSAWSSWSDCSAVCGFGTMKRERHVIKHEVNGGQSCPELLQKRSCYGSQCDKHSHSKANREIAMILPATYSVIRQLNASHDIRSNLRLRYRKDPEQEKSKEYCVVFELLKTKKACENLATEISLKIEKGSMVCVSCETAAMRKHLGYRCQGHGVEHKSTRFAFLSFPQCHGRWKKKETVEKCNCDEEGKANFIFV